MVSGSSGFRRLQRLLNEAANTAGVIGVDTTERGRIFTWNPYAGHRRAGTAVDVEPDHLFGIHTVDVVGAENHYVVWIFVVDQVQRLIDRIGGAGIPARAEALLCRHRGDVLTRQTRQPPVLRDMAVQ